MSFGKVMDLAQGWIGGSTEFDWDDLPDHLRVQILTAAFSFCYWASNFERVITPDDPQELEP